MRENASLMQSEIRAGAAPDGSLPQLASRIIKEATERAEWPGEQLGVATPYAFYWLANEAIDPETEFGTGSRLWPLLLTHTIAVVHTHPNGLLYPSVHDMQQQKAMGVPWGIAPRGGEMFWLGSNEHEPYVGRAFRWGVSDCYELARDWYREQRGLLLPSVPRVWEFWKDGTPLFERGFRSAGFEELGSDLSQLKEGDGVLYRIRSKVWNHCAVYTDGKLLHHPGSSAPYDPGCLSRTTHVSVWQGIPHMIVRPT